MLKLGGRVEVHFHTQDEASLFLETNCSGVDEMEVELQLFSSFALRQMMNLGPTPITASLGGVLIAVDENAMAGLRSGEDGPILTRYPGVPGRKRFEMQVSLLDHMADSKFHIKGFGILSQGMGFYAPTSVIALLKFLSQRRVSDSDWQETLSAVARACGYAVMSNNVNLRTQHTMSRQLAQAAISDIRGRV